MLDAGLKTKHSRRFLPVFMSIQYLASSIQYLLLKLLQPRYYKNPGPAPFPRPGMARCGDGK
jgi:hypothetical protein